MLRPLALFALIAFLQLASSFRPLGGELYEVWAGKRQLIREFVHHQEKLNAVSLRDLPPNESLIVYYNHCGQTGRGRSISIRTAGGEVLASKTYRDESGPSGMMIPVRELLHLRKSSSELRVYYASREIPNGKYLAILR